MLRNPNRPLTFREVHGHIEVGVWLPISSADSRFFTAILRPDQLQTFIEDYIHDPEAVFRQVFSWPGLAEPELPTRPVLMPKSQPSLDLDNLEL